jgi:hydroxymethylpyrimidine/phosphomethylpyrimidine kinase
MMPRPVVLTIAGSDSGGGAGIQADLRTITAHGGFGTAVVTCVTAQNLRAVSAVQAVERAVVTAQLDAVLEGFPVRAAKTGMLYSREIIEAVALVAARPGFPPLVVDPVMVATSGARLLEPEGEKAYADLLFPRATVLTPNRDEAAVLLGRPLPGADDLARGAEELGRRCRTSVFLKGGHLSGDPVDFLWHEGHLHRWPGTRVEGVNTHGSGCILAAAIASRLADGDDVVAACEGARRFVLESLHHPFELADGTILLGLPPRD